MGGPLDKGRRLGEERGGGWGLRGRELPPKNYHHTGQIGGRHGVSVNITKNCKQCAFIFTKMQNIIDTS